MLVLASNSPRRRQLLTLLGVPFTIQAVEVDETPHPAEKPLDYVQRLACSKALQAAQKVAASAFILAADTTVAMEEAAGTWTIFGKPADAQEAEEMLLRLRGRTHFVFTGLALLRNADGSLWEDVCISEVPIRDFSTAEMRAYIASGDPFDKAGAYAIQHAAFHPVENFSGCFANVMGLPLCHLARLLAGAGISGEQHVALQCLQSLDYDCAVTDRLR
jgi:septum formation protein